MNWLTQFFLNPALVIPGIALASLPVLIHILSRLKYRTVRFAAMEFLLQSDELNRRRLILEQFLLLLLRVLAILLIMLLLARLVIDPSRLLALQGASVHHVILLDDTLSMREQRGENTVFDQARAALENLLSGAEEQRSGARVSILLFSAPDRPLVADRVLDGLLLQDVSLRLRALQCTFRTASPATALEAARSIVAADGGVSPQVHLITDFRTTDWQNRPDVISALESLKTSGADVQLIHPAMDPGTNLSIDSVSSDSSAVARGVPWRIHVTVQNHGTGSVRGLRARVIVDGTPLASGILFPELEPSSVQTVSHDITFQETGTRRVEVRLDDDVLLPDNRRHLTVEVSDRRQILILDDDQQQEDARFVAAALSSDSDLTGLAADIRTSQALGTLNLSTYDVIYLLNVRDLPADTLQYLRDYAEGGGGIAWFPGEQADLEWYRSLSSAEGIRLFPVPLQSIQQSDAPIQAPAGANVSNGSETRSYETPVFQTHPVFSVYNTPDSPFSESLHIYSWLAVADSWEADDARRGDSIKTVARLKNGAPIIFDHPAGKGRVLTCLIGAGKRWSNWPIAPAAWGYVVVQLSMHQYLQKRSEAFQVDEVSDQLIVKWSPKEYSESTEIYLPEPEGDDDAAVSTFVRQQATLSEDTRKGTAENPSSTATTELQLTFRQSDRPGAYRIRRFTASEGQPVDKWYVLNVPPSESRLQVADADLFSAIASLSHVKIRTFGAAESLSGAAGGRELRWILAAILFLILISEQLLSLRMSHHPEAA
ncbi:MAG: BatA domain-containing protein [Planctomyces sp.]